MEFENFQPLPLFSKSAKIVSLINVTLDNDVVRRFTTGLGTVQDRTPMADIAFPGNAASHKLPQEQDFINYYGPAHSLRTVSYADLIRDDTPELLEQLRDKIVFIGIKQAIAVGTSYKDAFLTSFGQYPMFGVEIHATCTANILHQEWIHRFPLDLEQMVLNLIAFTFAFVIFGWTPFKAGIFTLGVMLSWIAAAFLCFLNHLFIPFVVLVLLVMPTAFLLSTIYYYLMMRRSLGSVESALGIKLHLEK